MSEQTPTVTKKPATVTRRGVAKNLVVVAIFLVFTLVIGVAFAYFGGTSIPGGNGASASTTVNPGTTPTVASSPTTPSTVAVSWTASTLATGRAVTGYVVKRYDANTLTAQTILTACTGAITALTCNENNLPTGSWRYSITPTFATSWLGAESAKSLPVATVEKDVTPPVNVLTSTVVSGRSFKNLNTIYYLGSAAGSFTVTNALTDAASGPASSTTSALTGTSTGWTHTGSKVATPTGGPYLSNPFSWVAGTTTTPAEAVVGRDVQDNSASTTLTFTNDITGPVAAVSYLNGYEAGRSVAVTFTNSDAGSGVATRRLQRSSAPLTSATGACGTFSSFTRIGPVNPNSIYTDSQVTNAACYQYRYVVTDQLGNQTIATNANVVKIDYQGATAATVGLLSQWRLGESYVATDSFTGTSGALLTSRTGEAGATWTKATVNDTSSAVLSDAGRLRRNAVGGVTYLASGVSALADYQVSTDVVRSSSITGDYAGVVGRSQASDATAQGTRYSAVYSADAGAWQLRKSVGGVLTVLGTYPQALTANQSSAVTLDMRGSSIRLLVDGVERVAVTDSAITAAGRAGVVLGNGTTGASPTNTTGLHLDNFKIIPRAKDDRGINPGMYLNAPTLGVPGAINGDPDTATAFDGTNEYVQMTNTVGLPLGASVRSVEAWFKTTSPAQQVIFSYGNRAPNQEFGLWLDPGSLSLQTWGHTYDYTFRPSAALNDGVWHQVVTTYDGTSLTVYVDGVSLGSQAAIRNTQLESYGFGIGAIIAPDDLNSGKYLSGVLDEVSFYTTALDQTTISNHYALATSDPADAAGPTGGAVDAVGLVGTGSRYSTTTALSLAFSSGTDPSGLADSGAQLLRATGTLTSSGTADGVCGTFGSYTQIGGDDPSSPVADTVADQACYSYRYVVMDSLGNTTTYTSPGIKVETTAPAAPTLSYSALTNTAWSGSGSSVVYYRSGATSGSFTATAAATDSKSGIASYAFPAVGTNWTSTPGAAGVNTYAWSGAPAAPGTKQVTATNNASLTSANAPFTVTADDTAPTTGTVTNEASTRATTTNITFTTGTDAGSGLGTRLLQRQSATLTGSTCGTYGAFTTVTNGTNPTSPLANAVVPGNCYKYQYVVSDNVGNSSTTSSPTVLMVSSSYADTVNATSGLLNYYRLGESNPGVLDTFTGTAGTPLASHTADSGDQWTRRTGDTITAVLSNAGRLRKSSVSGGVGYYSNEVLTGADYLVEADITVKSLAGTAGVLGRGDINGAGTGTYYYARYDPVASGGQFQLIKNVNGNAAFISSYNQVLTVGSTYTLGLDMRGTLIRMFVNDVQRSAINDGSITAAGRAGVGFGEPGDAATPSDTAGLHLDNFNVPGGLVDSDSANNGTYVNGPTVGVAGALTGDSNTAATFDGADDFGTAARQVADDLSVEFWFKSTQGIGTGAQWYNGAGLVDASVSGAANDFGVSLRSDGKVVAGVGSTGSDVSITSSSGGYNNGAWHHVVFTRVKTGGAIKLYVDGALAASGTGASVTTLTGQANVSFGRIASGTNYYAGSLDEIALYTTALSATTVADHYAAR